MSEAKHTPGPWVFEEQWHGTAIKTEAKPGAETVARVSPRSDVAKEIATARLIAAAPELLEAAKDVVKWYGHHEGGPHIIAMRKAIAKAKGRE